MTPRCLYLKDCGVKRLGEPGDGCLHTSCQIAAGYLPRVAAFNRAFQAERENWLRFVTDRRHLARIYWAAKKDWAARGSDPDATFSMVFVWGGLVFDPLNSPREGNEVQRDDRGATRGGRAVVSRGREGILPRGA